MENQIEKTIEQIALEEYAREDLDKRYESIGALSGIIVGALSVVSFIFIVINGDTWSHDYAMLFFSSLVIGVMMGAFAMACVVICSLALRRDEKKIKKFISLLSAEKSRKIVSDYIQKRITSSQEKISYCEKEIERLQLEIEELRESIEESKLRIPELQETLKNL